MTKKEVAKRLIILALVNYPHEKRIKILEEIKEMYESEVEIFGESK